MTQKKRTTTTPPKAPALPTTITIPGGRAMFYTKAELPPRRSRPLDVINLVVMPRLQELAIAQEITDAADPSGKARAKSLAKSALLNGPPVGLTREDADNIAELSVTMAWAYLKSWTLDEPLPETPDDMLDLSPALYKAITDHTARIYAANVDINVTDDFTVDGLPDDLDAPGVEDRPTSV